MDTRFSLKSLAVTFATARTDRDQRFVCKKKLSVHEHLGDQDHQSLHARTVNQNQNSSGTHYHRYQSPATSTLDQKKTYCVAEWRFLLRLSSPIAVRDPWLPQTQIRFSFLFENYLLKSLSLLRCCVPFHSNSLLVCAFTLTIFRSILGKSCMAVFVVVTRFPFSFVLAIGTFRLHLGSFGLSSLYLALGSFALSLLSIGISTSIASAPIWVFLKPVTTEVPTSHLHVVPMEYLHVVPMDRRRARLTSARACLSETATYTFNPSLLYCQEVCRRFRSPSKREQSNQHRRVCGCSCGFRLRLLRSPQHEAIVASNSLAHGRSSASAARDQQAEDFYAPHHAKQLLPSNSLAHGQISASTARDQQD